MMYTPAADGGEPVWDGGGTSVLQAPSAAPVEFDIIRFAPW